MCKLFTDFLLSSRRGSFTLPMSSERGVCAGFGYQYPRLVGKAADGCCAFHIIMYISFVSCHQYRKGGEQTDSGFRRYTSWNTCESVIISWERGKRFQCICQLIGRAAHDKTFLSSSSRMVCTWGRIRRPLGACMSCGITSNTKSPSVVLSCQVMVCWPKSVGSFRRMAWYTVSMPVCSLALTVIGVFRRPFRLGSDAAAHRAGLTC